MEDEKIITKKKSKGWIFGVLLILIAGGLIGTYYIKYFNNPIYVIGTSVSDRVKKLDYNIFSKVDSKYIGTLKSELKVDNNDLKQSVDVLNKMDIRYELSNSSTNNITNFKLYTKYNDKEMLNVNLYNENNSGYLYLDNLYDKYINLYENNTTIKDVKDFKEDDANNIADGLKKSIEGAFAGKDFTRSKATLTINGKEKSVYKNVLTIDKNNYQRIFRNIFTSLKDNENFIGVYNKFDSKTDVKKELETVIEDLETRNEKFGEILFTVYTSGFTNKLEQISIDYKNEEGTININLINNELSINVVSTVLTSKILITKVNKNSYAIKVSSDNVEGISGSITLTITKDKVGTIEKKDVSNSVKVEEITEEEMSGILEKLMKQEGIESLMNAVSSLTA